MANRRQTLRPDLSEDPVPWWLWPHLCSLDAPLVAVIWQRWWAHVAGVKLTWREEVIVALAVWMIYLADRLADVACRPGSELGTTRHRFYDKTRTLITVLTVVILATLGVVTPQWLPAREFRAGMALLALGGCYFWVTHLRSSLPWTTWLPKEVAVGCLFAFGGNLFVLCNAPHISGTLLFGLTLWAAVCFLNCASITRWESSAHDLRDPRSLLNAFPLLTKRLPTICLLLAVTTLALAILNRSTVFLPLSGSALLLWSLEYRRARLSADALRLLADVVLLTPCCLLPFVR